MTELEVLSWPAAQLGQAMEALARRAGLPCLPLSGAIPPPAAGDLEDFDRLERWFDEAARTMGLEAEPAITRYAGLEQLVRGAAPAVLRLPGPEGRFLLLLGRGRRRVSILGPELRVHRVPVEAVHSALSSDLEASEQPEIERLLAVVGAGSRQRARARGALLQERLGERRLAVCWMLRIPPGADFRQQLRHAGAGGQVVALSLAHSLQYGLSILTWWVVGLGVLQGRLDRGWLMAWMLLLVTQIPLRMLATWLTGRIAVDVGGLLKQRLLAGTLQLLPEEIRREGAGQLLARVLESDAVETMAINGGVLGLLAVIELGMAAVVLGQGAGGAAHVLLLAGWIGLALLLGRRYHRRRRQWTRVRMEMTHAMVEQMVGHRTRLVQEGARGGREVDDQVLERYLSAAGTADRAAVWLLAWLPRGWLLAGTGALAVGLIRGQGEQTALAVAVGGILLAHRSLKRLTAGVIQLAGAAVAWQQAAPVFSAAAREERASTMVLQLRSSPARPEDVVIEARDLQFCHAERAEPVLRGVDLQVRRGDRLLLEGPSGSGKSTLGALLAGLRSPDSGLLLLHGLDWQSLGASAWRGQVVAAPQFHENHILSGTFSFNLLMGRRWPPHKSDLEEAEALCGELGLGGLLERMPAGMLQMVGETGWQLSHGERSRVYLARALLQGAELLIFDESFAALDPETLEQCLRCVLARAPSLLVIAHP